MMSWLLSLCRKGEAVAALQDRLALEAQAAAEERECAAARAAERHAEEQLRKDLDVRYPQHSPSVPCLPVLAS